MKPLLVIGDALLDRDVSGRVERLCPDAPVPVLDEEGACVRPGGAGLAAALAAADGREVTLVTALGCDAAGRLLGGLLEERGVEVVDLRLAGPTPEKIRLRAGGRSLLRLDRACAPSPIGGVSAAARAAIGWAEAVLVSDYGRGLAAHPLLRGELQAAARDKPLIWDPHVRGAQPVPGAALVTPNQAEADCGEQPAQIRGQVLAREWRARNVCVTCGADGAVLCSSGELPISIPAPGVSGGDPCGAGDRFSSAAAGALADGLDVAAAVRLGVECASAFVAAGGAQALATPESPVALSPGGLASSVAAHRPAGAAAGARGAGEVVVAAGGCFDLLHMGHVRMLQAARALGDRLVVCLNSDASVKRLKGAARPVVAQQDRAAVLAALECVDEVLVFDEDTPVELLERLRPDIWAKGGDYVAHELPEAPVLARWGGRVVTLPYIDGHSTTRLLEEVSCRVAS